MHFLLLLLPLAALGVSGPMTAGVIRLARRLDLTDKPDAPHEGGRKWHGRPIPNTGGIAIYWGVALPMLAGLAAVWLAPDAFWSGALAQVRPYVPGLRTQSPLAAGVLIGALALHVLGLIDDRLRLGPFLKLGVQIVVAAVLAVGWDVRILEFLGTWWGPAGMALSVAVTVLWVLTITNAMNFLDNMDGLSAGIGAIIAAIYLAANLVGGQWFVAALSGLLLGALLGFLIFNFPPARVFMGDGGSLVLGFLLAVISIRTTYYVAPGAVDAATSAAPMMASGGGGGGGASGGGASGGGWYGVLMPLVVMAVPLYDITTVTIYRLARGLSPFHGDRNHFSHRLVRRGLSQRAAVAVIWMCTLATGLGGVMLRTLSTWQALLVAGQTAAVLGVLALLEKTRTGDETIRR